MKVIRIVFCLLLTTVALLICRLPMPVLAQEETIELEATYPRVEGVVPDATFRFTVDLVYEGDRAREFELRAIGPPGWETYVTSSDGSARISVIKVEPGRYRPQQVRVIATTPPSVVPLAGDYRITLEANSGTLMDSIELTAVVMPRYSLDLFPESGYREVKAGEDNLFFMTVRNTGSGELTGIRFSADKPGGVIVEFRPEEIDRLAPGSFKEVEVNIKPPADHADRYYDVQVTAEASQVQQTATLRIRVEESTWLWAWVGGGIALLVIAGFVIVFLRLGRGK